MSYGELLKGARNEAGMSQVELAAATGTSQPTISAYEKGTKQPRVGTLSRLLAATGHRLETEGPAGGGPQARERGRRLAEVLALAESLPARHRGPLAYPRLLPLRNGGAPSRG